MSMIFTREHNHLMPQTQEAWIAECEERVKAWETVFEEDKTLRLTFPEWYTVETDVRSQRCYKYWLRQLEAVRSDSTEGLTGSERDLWEKGGLL